MDLNIIATGRAAVPAACGTAPPCRAVARDGRAADMPLGRVARSDELAGAIAPHARSVPPSIAGGVIEIYGASHVR